MENEEDDFRLIEDLLSQTDDELYLQLGQTVSPASPDERELFGRSAGEWIAAGKSWLNTERKQVTATFCTLPSVIEFRRNPRLREQAQFIARIADTLSAYYGKPPAFLITVLFVREGIEKICDSYPLPPA